MSRKPRPAANSGPAPKRKPPPRGRPWPKGVSGNPSGLSRDVCVEVAECRRLARSHAPYAIERLAAMLDSKDDRVVVAAAEGLLDRAGLKPYSTEPERLEVTATVDVDALRATLAQRVAGLVLAREPAALHEPAEPSPLVEDQS